MKTDRVFVLLLVVLLPLSGCFDGSTTGDAEGADAADDSSESTAVINNYYNNTTTSSESQERTWYSSGNTYFTYWNDGQMHIQANKDVWTGGLLTIHQPENTSEKPVKKRVIHNRHQIGM